MSDIFCKIIAGEIKSDIIAEDKDWIAINDIHPKTPVHVLIIPRIHTELENVTPELAGKLLVATNRIAKEKGIDKTGFRVIINNGEHAGQEVPHLHIHVMGGKKL